MPIFGFNKNAKDLIYSRQFQQTLLSIGQNIIFGKKIEK
jgi:hypothetical protein